MKPNYNFTENLNILDGIISYNDFNIKANIPFKDQKYSYKEDLLQIKFGERFILDVSWQPEFTESGHFVIRAVLENDWINPLSEIKCKNLNDLKENIEKIAIFISKQRKKNLPHRKIEYEEFD